MREFVLLLILVGFFVFAVIVSFDCVVGVFFWVWFGFLFLMGSEGKALKLEKDRGTEREKWLYGCIQICTFWFGPIRGDSYSLAFS